MSSDGTDETTGRVAAAANRLRAVQADFADGDGPGRRDFLLEEIDRAVASVLPGERRAFLEKLQDRFPSWDQVDVRAPAKPPAAQSAGDAKELRDWTFLVGRLAELAPALSAADRAAAADRLAAAGLGGAGGGGWSPQHAAALKAKMQLEGDEQVNPNRAAELIDLMYEVAGGLDQLAWNTWKQIAPQSPTKRSATPLPRVLARFAAGDPEVPRAVATAEVGRLRRLVAALISSVGQVGGKFARDYCGQFAPTQIEDVVKAQGGGGGLFSNAKGKFWDQYVQMSAARDPASVEHEFVTAFAEYAELLMKSGGR